MKPENPHAGQGAVLLDIGGQVGALVVSMPDGLAGMEIEARQVPSHGGHPRHVEVLRRPAPTGDVWAAVFGELEAGVYELYQRPSGPVRLRVAIRGGAVTHATWPGSTTGLNC